MEHLLKLVAVVALMSLPSVATAAEQVIAEKPVRIATSSDPDIFPASWQQVKISASGRGVLEEQFERIRAVLGHALQKYPPEVLQKHLKAIYVLSDLQFYGIEVRGTNSRTSVYLNIFPRSKASSDYDIESGFHHEFSSILLRNCPIEFDDEAWQKVNPSGFKYFGNGVDAVKQKKASLEWREDLHAQGFLNEYSQSSMENDFNEVAMSLLSGDAALWDQAARFPKLKEKLALTVGFYYKLDLAFTEAYFRSLVKR